MEWLVDLQSLFNDRDCSDVALHCGDKAWYCHRAILYSRCPLSKDLIYDVQSETYQFGVLLTLIQDGADPKITLRDDCEVGVEQMLIYIYSLIPPKFSLRPKHDEAEHNETWIRASQAYLKGVECQLGPPKKAKLDAFLTQAAQLCKHWRRFDEGLQQQRRDVIFQVWADWTGPELVKIRPEVLKGLVRNTAKMVDSQSLQGPLMEHQDFMLDYVWIPSSELGEMKG